MRWRDLFPEWIDSTLRHFTVWRTAWTEEKGRKPSLLPQGKEVEFLPAVLEIQHAPPSPIGRAILWSIMLLFTAAIVWACLGQIDIVAIARGRIVPGGHTKTIQPLESGIVTAIHVRDGQPVQKGEVLIELDPTVSGADLERTRKEHQATLVDIARLRVLARENENFSPPPEADPIYVDVQKKLLTDQEKEFAARRDAATRVIEQRQSAINSAKADIQRLEQILPIVNQRATSFKALYEEGHASLLEAEEVERERIERVQELVASKERLISEKAALAEAEKNLEAITSEFQKSIRSELAQLETRAQILSKEIVKAAHTDQRQTLRAPVDGTVQQLSVHTVGGVVTPAQPLMVIVPEEDGLEVEAWIENKDIGFVEEKQDAEIKIDAFPFTKYGTVSGKVLSLSKDAVAMEDIGHVFSGRINMNNKFILVENGKLVKLSPGMNVNVEIKTGERYIVDFLFSPIIKFFSESAKER